MRLRDAPGPGDPFDPALLDALAGPLVVRPPGGALVATDGMLAHAATVAAVVARLREQLARTGAADGLGSPVDLGPLREHLLRAERLAATVRDGIVGAATAAARGEADLRARQERAGAITASALGPLLPWMLFGVGGSVLGVAAWSAALPGDGSALQDWLLEHPEIVTSPAFVRAVETIATSLDDGALVAAGLRWPGAWMFERGVGEGEVAENARLVVALGVLLGLFRETPVAVERVGAAAGTAPVGAADRLSRVPEVDQVRIERYDAPDRDPRWVVYLGPTETFDPVADDEPWDLTSNVWGVAGLPAGSFRAAELAMQDAGIAARDEIVFVGFSQGGMLAAMLAASGHWNAAGIETYGAPIGTFELPEGLAGMAVRHTDDLVPALAGPSHDQGVLRVEREAFAGDAAPPTGLAAPAHQRVTYLATAAAIDRALSPEVRAQLERIDEFTRDYASAPGGGVSVLIYRGERVPGLSACPPS